MKKCKKTLKRYNELSDAAVTLKHYARMKSLDTVMAEIRCAVLKHPQIKKIAFIDDNLLMYPDYTGEFCRRYRCCLTMSADDGHSGF